jgi:hypothetical protein
VIGSLHTIQNSAQLRIQRVTQAFLKMEKFDIGALKRATVDGPQSLVKLSEAQHI